MNDRLKIIEQQSEWQLIWREVLGQSVGNTPEDPECDFALHFDVWNLELAKQQECFSPFPNGQKMLEHANKVRFIKPEISVVDDNVLLEYLENMKQQIDIVFSKSQIKRATALNDELKSCTKRAVYRGDFDGLQKQFENAVPLTDPLSEIMRDLLGDRYGDKGHAMYEFLHEPFYRASNDTGIAESIFWKTLSDHYEADPYNPYIELYKIEAIAGWDDDKNELFVFIEQ